MMRLLLHTVPAHHGKRWLAQGWQIFRKAPLPLSALIATYLVAWMLAGLLGMAGAVIMLASLPLLSLVYMVATHQLLQQRPLSFGVWALPFKINKARTHAQLQLGLLYVIFNVLLMLVADAVDGGGLERLMAALNAAGTSAEGASAAEAALTEALGETSFLSGLALRILGTALLSVPFWHAPALVHWGGHSALKALFASCVGVWNNRGAFLVNAFLWIGLMIGASLLLGLVLALMQAPALLSMLVMPLILFGSTVFYCGLYFTFVDCFRFAAEEGSAPPAA